MIQHVTSPQKTMPAAADPITVTSGGSAWTFGAWTELTASAPSDGMLTGIIARTTEISNRFGFEIEVGVGGAGSEVIIATVKGMSYNINGYAELGHWPFFMGIRGWSAGDRLSFRVRTQRAAVITFLCSLTYLDYPTTGYFQTTTNPVKVLPYGSWLTCSTGGSSWAWGAYQTVIDPLPTDIAILGIVFGQNSNGGQLNEMQISTGSAGNETVVHWFRDWFGYFVGYPYYTPLPVPLKVSGGSRLAMRVRDEAAFPYTGGTVSPALVYVELPL